MTTTATPPPATSAAGAMSFAQIEQLWIQNGGNAAVAPVMAAIAIAESGGHPTSLNNNPSTGDYSVGLWQINYYNGLLASRTASYGSPAALQGDANAQARAAISLSADGTNLAPWRSDPVAGAILAGKPIPTQYTNGQSVTAATQAAQQATNTPAAATVTCTPVIGEGGILGIGSATLLNSCQAQEIVGVGLMGVGALFLIVGFAIVLADLGLHKGASAIVGGIVGDRIGRASVPRSVPAAREPKEDGATKAARAEYNRQQRGDYNRTVKGTSKEDRPRPPIGKTQPNRGF